MPTEWHSAHASATELGERQKLSPQFYRWGAEGLVLKHMQLKVETNGMKTD